MSNTKQQNVVIIGAGPAGLTAAYELLSQPEAYHVQIRQSRGQQPGQQQARRNYVSAQAQAGGQHGGHMSNDRRHDPDIMPEQPA